MRRLTARALCWVAFALFVPPVVAMLLAQKLYEKEFDDFMRRL